MAATVSSRALLEQTYPELVVWIDSVLVLPWQKLVMFGASFAATYTLTCFILKAVLLWALRILGLHSPKLYAYLPSAIPCWRNIAKVKYGVNRWAEIIFKAGKRASGGFSSPFAAMTLLYTQAAQIPLGRAWLWGMASPQTIALNVDRHFCVIGATGAGKSVLLKGVIIEFKGSIFLIDAKNEMEESLSAHDKRQWVSIKPYSPENSDQINPLDVVKMALSQYGESLAVRAAYVIGTSLIETPPDAKQPFFTQASSGMLVGLVLFVIAHFTPEYHTLGFIRTLITRGLEVQDEDGSLASTPEESKALLYKKMRESSAFSGAILGAASAFIHATNEARGSLEATLAERTKIFDIAGVRHVTNATTRPLHELKTCDDYVLSIGASVQSIRGELKDLFKLYLNIVLFTFEITPKKKGKTLLLAEEFNAQGYNSVFESAIPVIRSMGLNAGIIIQDVESLKAAYPKTYRAFMGNSSFVLWLATNHLDNLNEIHQILGRTSSAQIDPKTGKRAFTETDVMTTQQIAHFLNPESGNAIVTRMGKRALRIKTLKHYEDVPLMRYSADTEHKAPLLKHIMRRCLTLFFRPKRR